MTNPNIRIKRSAVPGKRPSNSQMELGELALNTNDGRIFTKQENVGIGTTVTLLNVWTENIGGGAYYNDGFVGIGTTNPQAALEVVSTIPGGGIRVSSTGTNSPGFRLINNDTQAFAQNLLALGFGNGLVGSVPGDYCIRNSSGGGILLGISTSLGITNPNQAIGYVRLTPSGELLVGTSSTITTGTTSQPLQVNGGAYFNGNVGIGTTNPTSRLQIQGDVLVSGVVTATAFNGDINSNKATIQDLSGTNLNYTGIATVNNLAVNDGFDVYATNSTFHENLVIEGNLTVNGTQVILNVDEKFIKDKQIVLGFSTTNNVDDITANGGGFGIASTEGSPLVCLQCTGINTLPSTYKQLIWTRANTFGAGTTDAFLFNYAVGIGSTLVPNGVRLSVGGVQITDSAVNAASFTGSGANLTNLNASNLTSGTVPDARLSGTYTGISINTTGIITAASFTGSGANLTNLNASNISSGTLNNARLPQNISVSGIVTAATFSGNLQNTLTLNTSGIGLSGNTTFNNSGASTFTVTSNATSANTNNTIVSRNGSGGFVAGIVTATFVGNLTGNLNSTGVNTATTISGTTLTYTNGTITNLNGTNVSYSGIGTVGSLNIGATQVISSGRQLQNIASLDATTTATIETAIANAPNTFTDLQVTGISTFVNGPVFIGSGTSTGTATQKLQVTGGAYVSGNVGIGTTNAITQLHLSGFSTTNSNLKIGSLEFQNYSLNNSFFGDNVYWNGSNMVRRSSGYAGLFYFINDEGQFRLSPIGLANSETNNNPQLKINSNGGFGIGSSLSQNANNFTGANFYVNPGGVVMVGTISSTGTASQRLQVTGGAYVSGNIGIGTTNPTSKLHIVGDEFVTGVITASNFFKGSTPVITGIGIGSTSINPGSGSITGRVGYGFTDINIVGVGVSVVGYGSTLVLDFNTIASARVVNTFTATEGQTIFNVTHNPGFVDVYVNGVRLATTEFVATNGTTVLLNVGASAGDNVSIITYQSVVGGSPIVTPGGSNTQLQFNDSGSFNGDSGLTYNKTTKNLTVTGFVTASTFSGNLQNTLTLNTSGTGLSGSTTFNNSGASTFTVASNATSANTNSTIVSRDGSGNFSAGTITANLSGNATGLSGTPNITVGVVTATDLTVSGNLTVNGTTTTLNTETLRVEDKNIELGVVSSPTNTTADGGGITLKGATDKTFNWVNATSSWTSSENLNLLTGKTYKINGTDVLSSTTLGSGVVNSSLTSVGTLTKLDVGNVNSTGIVTATSFVGSLSGTATSTTNIPNLSGDVSSVNTVTTLATVNSNVGTFGSAGAIPVVIVNGKGLVTGISTVAVPNGALTLNVSGTGLSGSASFTSNQAGASTFTVTSNATSANTNNAIVARNGAGGFSAGVVTATTFSGNLQNTLTLNTSGTGLSGSTTFNNSGASTFTVTSNATSANTNSTIVSRDGAGGFVAGIVTATDFNSASDLKLKENIQAIENPIDKILNINGVSFDWKETGKSSMGVIAQDVEKVLPELVNGTDSKTVNYNGLIGLLIEVVKEQQKEINILKERLS